MKDGSTRYNDMNLSGLTVNKFRQFYDRETVGDSDTKPTASPNLLTIELTDEQSIPRIVYKGEDVTALIAVDFEWSTRDDKQIGSTYFRIKHANIGSKKPVVETKELAVGERAYGA
ncbi:MULTISPECIES: hypothetical protein [unclassified Bacillus (in: firmicutes)]|uniref:hypothetical protein n=1 Tax=unclassified Bacillus (in: firmicutes) TaxID=185979 RepID=UPI001F5C584F|nr:MULTISPECIES: hypothetical protein [unclassified Bacillus (in: firmicutes)]